MITMGLISKKASMELSVNFLVVMIICLVLLGIGITLIMKGKVAGEELIGNINEAHKDRISRDLSNGKLFSIYPTSQAADRGEPAEFTFGIRNEEESQEKTDFCLSVKKDVSQDSEAGMLFSPGPYKITSKELFFSAFRITMPKTTKKGSYMFDVRVKVSDSGSCDESLFANDGIPNYGYLKIQLNVN